MQLDCAFVPKLVFFGMELGSATEQRIPISAHDGRSKVSTRYALKSSQEYDPTLVGLDCDHVLLRLSSF